MSRISRVGLACAVAAITFILVLLLRSVGESAEQAADLKEKLDTTTPATVEDLTEITNRLNEIVPTVVGELIPTLVPVAASSVPPPIVPDIRINVPTLHVPTLPELLQGPPGKPGASGAPGRVVVVRSSDTSQQTVRPAAKPDTSSTSAPQPLQPPCIFAGLIRIGTVC